MRPYRTARLAVTFAMLCCGFVSQAQQGAATSLAEAAQTAQAAGRTTEAMELYSKALQARPDWTDGWWKYGGLLYQDHQYKAATGAFARLTQLAPENPLGYALLGVCEYETGDWNNAVLHLNKALNQHGLPTEIANVALYDFGRSLMRVHNRNGALIAFRFLFHEAPSYPTLPLALGSAELGLEDLPAPDAPVFSAAELAGQAAVAVIALRPKDAEASYLELVKQYPDLPYAHLSFGIFLESEHRDEDAVSQFRAETKVSAHSAVPWIWLARVELAEKHSEEAFAAAAEGLVRNPGDPVCYLIEGRSLMLEQQWEKALPPLQEAERLAPESSEVHFALASVYNALHRESAAETERKLFLDTSAHEDTGEGVRSQ